MVVDSANILGVFSVPSISHQKSFLKIGKELSLRGHQVTLIVTNPLKDKSLTNLTEIDINHAYDLLKKRDFTEALSSKHSVVKCLFNANHLFEMIDEVIFNTQEVKDLIQSDRQFDLVLVEPHDSVLFAFGPRFNAPIVGKFTFFKTFIDHNCVFVISLPAISSLGVLLHMHDAIGNPSHPFLTPEILIAYTGTADAPFLQRLNGLWYSIWYRALFNWYFLPRKDKIVKQHFGDKLPYLGDIISQTSLLMTTANPIMDTVRPNIPIVINLELLHIEEPKVLPKVC